MELGLQLYTLRELMTDEDSIKRTLKSVKEIGYSGVQIYGNLELAEKMGLAAIDNGLTVMGSTMSFDLMCEQTERVIDLHKRLATENAGIGGYFKYTGYEDALDFIKRANSLAKKLANGGLRFSYHNHSHEFLRVTDEKTIFDLLCEGLDENIDFVLDTYWIQHGGADVRYWIEKLASRTRILHIKDMKMTKEGPAFAEIGCGNLRWDLIVPLANRLGIPYLVVEQDRCDGDPLECVKTSFNYMKKHFM